MNIEKDKVLPVREKLEILVCYYPFWQSLNPKLDLLIKSFPDEYQKTTNVKAKMTHYCVVNEDFMKIGKWVYQKLPEISEQSLSENSCFKLVDIWGVLYDKGDYTISHRHRPFTYSFVYFVNTPPNSSPLVFENSNLKINPEPGKCVIFPSSTSHYVPKNKANGRSVISGNFVFVPNNRLMNFF